MRPLDPYIFFDGNCTEAVRFYERELGAKVEFLATDDQVPPDAGFPPGKGDRVMHVRLNINGSLLMASDGMPGQAEPRSGFSLSLSYKTPEEARRAFDALAAGGKVTMELQKTFWSPAFGMVRDAYDVPWMINCDETHS